MRRAASVAFVIALAACAGPGPVVCPKTADRLRVVGHQLTLGGRATRLLGVNHSGFEYACVTGGGHGFTEGPDPDTMAGLLAAWGSVNAVRLPLNEDCWLGINGATAYGGPAYRDAVTQYVRRLHAHGLFVIVDLHWSAPGEVLATGQEPMADRDHAPAFWGSVARSLGDDPMALFDLFNEPFLTPQMTGGVDPWACWADGCTVTVPQSKAPGSWQSAGMNELVAAVRGAGATNVLLAGGLGYANDLTGWLAHAPRDPLGQLAASFHVYDFNPCSSAACWDAQVQPVAQRVPVFTGELGEGDCAHGFIDGFMPWADARGLGYLGWAWNAWDCRGGPSLVPAYDGSVTAFGQGLRDHLRALPR